MAQPVADKQGVLAAGFYVYDAAVSWHEGCRVVQTADELSLYNVTRSTLDNVHVSEHL